MDYKTLQYIHDVLQQNFKQKIYELKCAQHYQKKYEEEKRGYDCIQSQKETVIRRRKEHQEALNALTEFETNDW